MRLFILIAAAASPCLAWAGLDASTFFGDLFALLGKAPPPPPSAHPASEFAVIGLGLPRTGTKSLAVALKTLGNYNVFHTRHLIQHRHHLLPLLASAHENPEKYIQAILGLGFNATTDFATGVLLADYLVNKFPNAKVILTLRDDLASWEQSLSHSLDALVSLKLFPWTWIMGDLAPLELVLQNSPYRFVHTFSPCRSNSTLSYYLPWISPCLQRPISFSMPPADLYAAHQRRVAQLVAPDRL
jgi:hypothetical protein